MNWIIMVVIFAGIGFLLGRFVFGFRDNETGGYGAIIGALIVALIAIIIGGIYNIFPTNVQYEIADEKTHALKTFENGSYYTCSTVLDKSYVDCLLLNNDGTLEKKNFVANTVKINPDAKEASIIIKNGKASSADFFGVQVSADTLKSSWWIDITDKEEIVEIIINVPQHLDYPDIEQNTESNKKPNIDENNENKMFCTSCGEAVHIEWSYCGNCGTKLKE